MALPGDAECGRGGVSRSEAGSHLRLIDVCITQL